MTMKKLWIIWLLAATSPGFAQGLVKFANNGSTLVSWGPVAGPYTATPPGPSFYYALLTAPLGTTDPTAFTFSGLYATNTTTTTGGRLQGGSPFGVPVAGWAAGESRSFEVAAWSADAGPTWNPAWLTDWPPWFIPFFGLSSIGQGFAGGTDSNGASLPALAIFGAAPSITSGFSTVWIPEPSGLSFAAFAALFLLFRPRSQ